MKLSQDSIKQLTSLLSIANVSGIDRIIINSSSIRGIDSKKTLLLIDSNDGKIDLDGANMAISRPGTLASMMNLIGKDGDDKLNVEIVRDASGSDVVSLKLVGNNSKAEFRCAATEIGDAIPRALNSVPSWEFALSGETVTQVVAAASALGADRVGLMYKNGEMSFEVQYSNTDSIVTRATSDIHWLREDEPAQNSFYHIVPCKSLFPLLKVATSDNDFINVVVGSAGVVTFEVKKLKMFVLPIRAGQ